MFLLIDLCRKRLTLPACKNTALFNPKNPFVKYTVNLILLYLVFVITTGPVTAQNEFSKVYSHENGYFQAGAVCTTFDNAYLIAGNGNDKNFIMKIDLTGELIWHKTIDPYSSSWYANIIALKDSTFLFVSDYYKPEANKSVILCVNLNTNGDTLWTRSYDLGTSSFPYSVAQTFDAGFIITGSTYQNNAPYRKMIILKLDSIGNLQWSQLMVGGNNVNYGYSVKQTPDTGFIVTGFVENITPFNTHAYLMKLTPSGSISWSNSYQLTSTDFNIGYDVVVTEDGFLTGMLMSDKLILMKTDFSGNVAWVKMYNANPEFFIEFPRIKIQKMQDGGYTVSAPDALLKVDSAGNVQWVTGLFMYVADMVVADDGFLIVGNGPLQGVKLLYTENPQIGIIKTDTLGRNDSECLAEYTPIDYDTVVTSNAITFTSESIGIMISTNIQLSTVAIEVETGCVAFVGAVKEDSFGNNTEIFPNPTNGILNIQITNTDYLTGVEVYNTLGERVYKSVGLKTKEVKIDLSNQPNGIYFLKLTNNNKVYSREIVKY